MPRRPFTGPRTPRKEKFWAVNNTFVDITTPSPAIVLEPLETAYSAMGIDAQVKATVMRCFGSLTLVKGLGSDPVTPEWQWVRFGLLWVRQDVANAGGGDAQIPAPLDNGPREAEWIQQWQVGAIEDANIIGTFPPLDAVQGGGKSYGTVEFDVTQMRQQPTINHRLVLIRDGGDTWEDDTVRVHALMSLMVAVS